MKKLTTEESVPATVSVAGRRVATDVLELGTLRLEGPSRHVRCGTKQGAAGIYARREGQYFAVSCSHVLKGDDSLLTDKDQVEHYESAWRHLGPAVAAHEDLGYGTTSDWGAFDAGLARIEDPHVRAVVASLPQAVVFDSRRDPTVLKDILLNQRVYAIRGNGDRLDAEVFGLFINDTGRDLVRLDALIRHPNGLGLTRPRDSGILWRLADKTPLAIHFGGYAQNAEDVSTISAAFFVARLTTRFNVDLLAESAV